MLMVIKAGTDYLARDNRRKQSDGMHWQAWAAIKGQ
jgi:hypothetical protein